MTPELEVCLETFRRWLHLPDPGHVLVVLAGVVANRAEGDPVWPMLVGGPGWGKTEALNAVTGQPDVHPAATLTEAALLSGTPRREAKGAKGGLLKEIGDFGIIALKDFGSILSMNRDTRAQLLAALREVYDGSWTRHVGVDGGRTLAWQGKVGLIAGCTSVIDSYHGVMSQLGDRFVFYRMPAEGGDEQMSRALEHSGHEKVMRAELAEAARIVLEAADMEVAAAPAREEERDQLVRLAELAVRCRSAVERDPRTREIDLVPEPEAPARLGLNLLRLLNALQAIGADHELSWRIVSKCALDCMPAIRRKVAETLLGEYAVGTPELATRIDYPTTTTRRALEDLVAHGLAKRAKRAGKGAVDEDLWTLSEWTRKRWPDISPTDISGTVEAMPTDISGTVNETEPFSSTVPEKSVHAGEGVTEGYISPTDISGTVSSPNGSTVPEMSEGAQILAELRSRGLTLRLVDDKPVVGPAGRLDDADRYLLTEHKAAIVAALRAEVGR